MSDEKPEPEAPPAEPKPAETGLAPAEAAPAPEPQQSAEEQLAALKAEVAGLKEQLLRRRADFENYRRRVERDRQGASEDAAADLFSMLIPTLDNLERALSAGGDEDSLREGVLLIQRELMGRLEGRGLKAEDPSGKPFDPERHQALSHEAVPGARPGTVVETFRKGYLFKDRLLRPALVKVAKEEGAEGPDAPERLH